MVMSVVLLSSSLGMVCFRSCLAWLTLGDFFDVVDCLYVDELGYRFIVVLRGFEIVALKWMLEVYGDELVAGYFRGVIGRSNCQLYVMGAVGSWTSCPLNVKR